VVIRLKVPIEMHYTVIPMGTSKVNSSPLQTIAWDIPDRMEGQFGPWDWTVRHLGPKCLLDTSVLVPKCSDPYEQCRSVSSRTVSSFEVSGYH